MTHATQLIVSVILISAVNLSAQKLTIRDIWTMEPVADVRCICKADTLYSDPSGNVALPGYLPECTSLELYKEGYFDQTVSFQETSRGVIYLTPHDYTSSITIVQDREPGGRLLLPAHISRISIDPYTAPGIGSVAELLDAESGVYIKSYGTGGQLGTLSLRGMGPEQTQVMLDGVPLNSIQNGNLNFGLYGLQSFSAVELYRGAHYQFGGNGALAGTVNLLPSKPAKHPGLQISSGLNTAGNLFYAAGLDLPAGPLEQRFYFEASENSNRQRIRFRETEVRLQNRDIMRRHLSYNARFEPGRGHEIGLYASQILMAGGSPKPFTGPNSEQRNVARQDSDLNLLKLRYTWNGSRGGVLIQPYVRNEWMSYTDKALQIAGQTLHSLHFNQESGIQVNARRLISTRWLLAGGAERVWYAVRSSDAGNHRRDRLATYLISDFLLYRSGLFGESLHLDNSLRWEHYSDLGSVLLPATGISSKWGHSSLFLTLGRQYRAPTFNDRYWQPGGNPDLRPEKSLHLEGGMRWQPDFWFSGTELQLSLYQMEIDEQIKWVPAAGYWEPRNILQVRSRGIEAGMRLLSRNRLHSLNLNLSYGQAVKMSTEFAGDETVGNRLPYDPGFLWNISGRTTVSGWQLGGVLSGRGHRYTTFDNLERNSLPAHSILDLRLLKNWRYNRTVCSLSAAVENVFGSNYEMIKGYPMPGRTYRVHIGIGCYRNPE